MVSIGIAKAFDAVDHDLLLEKVAGTALHSNIVQWLATYFRGRTAVCIWQGIVSKPHKCHSGVPQGSVISPQLFNFFVHDFPGHAQVVESYADDFALLESSPDL
jgi:retron-type reverse transcriptase